MNPETKDAIVFVITTAIFFAMLILPWIIF
jgi:hypothetical protein